jgi:hypothetical protein
MLNLGLSFYSFLIIWTVGRNSWAGDQLIAWPLHVQDNTNIEEMLIYVTRMGFEPTTSVFEQTNTVYVLYREATVIDFIINTLI